MATGNRQAGQGRRRGERTRNRNQNHEMRQAWVSEELKRRLRIRRRSGKEGWEKIPTVKPNFPVIFVLLSNFPLPTFPPGRSSSGMQVNDVVGSMPGYVSTTYIICLRSTTFLSSRGLDYRWSWRTPLSSVLLEGASIDGSTERSTSASPFLALPAKRSRRF